jgi:antitoxin StbD
MQTLFTELTISMSDFKKNPAKVLREAGTQPVAVSSHNKAAFYMVDPLLFEALMEEMADTQIIPILKAHLAQKAKAIVVDIDSV